MAAAVVAVWLGLVAMVTGAPTGGELEVDLRMPQVQPTIKDTYLCHTLKMGKKPSYLTGFIPHGNMSTAHHILLYGCTEPGSDKSVWNCGEMQAMSPGYDAGPVCAEGSQIVYAWGMDAPMLKLPKDVGFKVGGDTPIQYLVLQVHYKDVSLFTEPNNQKDTSGLTLIQTSKVQPKRAGVYLLGTGGSIPAHSTTYMETACSVDDPLTLHPFAYRVHAHTHGKVVAGYRVRDDQWEEIGRNSPQKPQMFYNVTHPGMTVKPGDILAARCTMVNNDDKAVAIGATQNDEMCNFYMMYYVDGPEILSEEYCFSQGPPHWYWSNMRSISVENAPDNASQEPGSDKVWKATEKFVSKMEDMADDVKDEFENLLNEIGQSDEQNDLFDDRYLDGAGNDADFDDEEFQRALRNYDPRLLEQYYRELYGYDEN